MQNVAFNNLALHIFSTNYTVFSKKNSFSNFNTLLLQLNVHKAARRN